MKRLLSAMSVIAVTATIRSEFFTIAEVAEGLHVAPRTVRRWIKAGDLVVHRVGGVVRIAEGDLRVFLALHREG